MNSSLLRKPLINSAVLIGLVSLVVYFTLTSPGGTVWSSFGAIFSLIIGTLQLVIGLSLGILVCIAVLIGIFLGAAAMSDPAGASRMYEALREKVLGLLVPLAGLFKSDHEEKLQAELSELGGNLKTDFNQLVHSTRQELTAAHAKLADKMQTLHGKLQAVSDVAGEKVSVEQLEELTTEISTLKETFTATDANVKTLQGKVEEALQKAGSVDATAILGDVPSRLETLEQQEAPAPVDLTPLEDKVTALQTEIDALKSALEATRAAAQKSADANPKAEKVEKPEKVEVAAPPEEVVEEASSEEPEHRLLAYFEDKAEQDKLRALVAETVKKDMTYAQVTDFLVKKMGKQGVIISEHPSLAKDYIRQCRRNA